MIDNKIVLGPLLGVESDTLYSVCILLKSHFLDQKPVLQINDKMYDPEKMDGEKYYLEIGKEEKYYFYRFEFEKENLTAEKLDLTYQIKINNTPLYRHNNNSWKFSICPIDSTPDVAFVSCNGKDDSYPTNIDFGDYKGWEQINLENPDYLILTGDQVYADKIWEIVPDVESFVIGTIDEFNEDNLDDFYIKLYIDSWSNIDMALAFAQIPNIMTWDDHDIVDGYGSYEQPYKDKLKKVFNKAKLYFELFQIRSKKNRSLINGRLDYSTCLKIRNYCFILPDTRSHRDKYTILGHKQYTSIANKILIENSLIITEKDIVCFILPVPIAYRDFSNIVEKGVFYLYDKFRKFNKSGSDDLIDHWDHNFHKAEQKIMLDFIFEVGETYNPKNILIVSGDVHSSGAAKITKHYKYNDQRYATQLISSPIVNESSGFLDKTKNFLTEDFKIVDNYTCNLLNFGAYPEKDFYTRNFVIVKRNKQNKIVAHIFIETKSGWTGEYKGANLTRTLNNYIN